MKILKLRRKQRVNFHFKSGRVISEVLKNCRWATSGNDLRSLTRSGSMTIDYLRLDEIEAITSKKVWRFYLVWE